jgi:hypothetical protein
MIRMNGQVPIPAEAVTGLATTPLPRPAEMIEKLGLWRRVPAAEQNGVLWVSTPGQSTSVLAVMAHPDDPELWAGGTLALHAHHAPVTLAITEHEAARMAEAAAGAAVLGARLVVIPSPISAAAVLARVFSGWFCVAVKCGQIGLDQFDRWV